MAFEGWIGVMDRGILFLMPLLVHFPTPIQLFSFSFLVFSNRIHRASSNISALLHSPFNYLWSSGKYEELPPPSGSVSDTCVNCFHGEQGAGRMEISFPGLRRLQGVWGCMPGLRVSGTFSLFLSIAVWHFSSTHKPDQKWDPSCNGRCTWSQWDM